MADPFAFCSKCGSDRIIPAARLIDELGGGRKRAEVGVMVKPYALFNKKEMRTPLRAVVCGACGYTELYVENPGALWRAYELRREHTKPRS